MLILLALGGMTAASPADAQRSAWQRRGDPQQPVSWQRRGDPQQSPPAPRRGDPQEPAAEPRRGDPRRQPAPWQRRGDQQEAFDALRQGRILPLRQIEGRVIPRMRGAQYIGFDFDSDSGIYTLKFLRDGNVIWVEVDGRSGQVLGRSGN